MLIAAPFSRAKSWKSYKYSSVDEWMKRMWYLSTVESDLSVERMEPCHWDTDRTGGHFVK